MNVNIALKGFVFLANASLHNIVLVSILFTKDTSSHPVSTLLHQKSRHEGNNLVSALITRVFAADAENIN